MKKTDSYNNEPVYFCKSCLSLKIRSIEGSSDMCYCDKCGNTSIAKASIFMWEDLCKQKKIKTVKRNIKI